jgi:transposase
MPATKRLGRPRATELRSVLDAILYIARTGCQRRMLAKDFPPFTIARLFLRLARRRVVRDHQFSLASADARGGGPCRRDAGPFKVG